jgi:hypothetical protein
MSRPLALALALLALAPAAVRAADPPSPAAADPAPSPSARPTAAQAAQPTPKPEVVYDVAFDARIAPSERVAHVTIRIGRHQDTIRWIRFHADPSRYTGWTADGAMRENGEWIEWVPPKGGGAIRYTLLIDHLRDARSYDARCANDWVLLRGHDLVPRLRIRHEDFAFSRSTLTFHVPAGWTVVTAEPPERKWTFALTNPRTKFDRPTDWIVAGRLGVVRETIAGMKVAIAGPVGHGVRRHDLLAMLRWTLRRLRPILGTLPERLTIVSAGDPMWRGGLSAPHSFFLHAERPLITPDLTSPLLHEVMHVVVGAAEDSRSDWIVEGLAEYYSLQLLERSKTVSHRRYERAMRRLARRGGGVRALAVPDSAGEITARAVTVLAELDQEIRAATGDEKSLDTVLARLAAAPGTITNARFRALAEEVAGRDLGAFFASRVGKPGKEKRE